jgi:hypothetical protein
MPVYSEMTITFIDDFVIGEGFKITVNDVGGGANISQEWTWVATRSAGFEVTEGTPTGTAGETSAINFKAAFDLDNPSGYVTTQTTNEVRIQSETQGEDFLGAKSVTAPEKISFSFINEETPIDNSNVDIALVRSPHYINVPFNFATTTAITANVYIWDGDLTVVPASTSYDRTIARPTTDFPEFNINVSKLVRSELEPNINIDLTSTPKLIDSTTESIKWIKYDVSYTDAEETIPDISFTLSSLDGYGLYSEGVNPTKSSNDWLTDTFNKKVSRDGLILIPFINRGNITSITVVSNGADVNTTLTPIATNESTDFVQYVIIDVANVIANDSYVTISDDTNTFIFEIEDECRYEPTQIIFKNRYGVFEGLSLFKKKTDSISVSKSTFTNAYLESGVYDVTKHQIKDINITATETLKLNTGFIKEAENESYKQMLVSDQIFIYDSALIPVTAESKSLDFKTRINDGLINYEINLKYAYNYIQNV